MHRVLLLLMVSLGAVLCLELVTGPVRIPPEQVLQALLGQTKGSQEVIVRELRLPRAVLALLAGVALSVSGAVFQGVFRNPMAEPYVLGVASGAALGMSIAMLYLKSYVLLLSFAFGLATLGVVYSIAGTRTHALLLAGVSVSLFLSALTSFILYLNARDAATIMFTLMGTLSSATWDRVRVSLVVLPVALLIYLFSRELNILTLGDENARVLGLEAGRMKLLLLSLSTLLASVTVSLCGIIGFVGLITPHIARLLVGQDFRLLLPAASLTGAALLMLADVAARSLAPGEVPVNIVTTLFGVPFFIYLLVRSRRGEV